MRYIDMDGVICNMLGRLEECTGIEHDTGTYELCLEHKRYLDLAPDVWWSNLPIFPWAKDLVKFDDVILTSPWNHASAVGKIEWLARHFLMNCYVISCIGKAAYANPKSILIDDCSMNIAAWRSRGGIGVLFPAPYNLNTLTVGDILNENY